MNAVVLDSVLTCPHCGFAAQETMPTDACLFFYENDYPSYHGSKMAYSRIRSSVSRMSPNRAVDTDAHRRGFARAVVAGYLVRWASMSTASALSAALNNAVWCDAVCRAAGGTTEFADGLWHNAVPSLDFHGTELA